MAAPSLAAEDTRICAFCGNGSQYEGGQLGHMLAVRDKLNTIHVHYLCAEWSPQVTTFTTAT